MQRFDHGPAEFGNDDLVVGNDRCRRGDGSVGKENPFSEAVTGFDGADQLAVVS
jgi:hypothetical protein